MSRSHGPQPLRRLLMPVAVADPPDPTVAGVAVLIDGPRIVALGRREEFAADDPEERLEGLTLVPGLIDAHLHLQFRPLSTDDGVVEAFVSDRDQGTATAVALAHAQAELAAGTTTVRDCASDGSLIALRDRFRGARALPRILVAGPPITTPGGHLWWAGRAAQGPAEVTRRVQEAIASGVDAVKIIVSGGMMTKGSDPTRLQFDERELAAGVTEAHRGGVPVIAHASNTRAIASCVEAGVDVIDHCRWLDEDGRPRFAEAVAARMAEAGTFAGLTAAGNVRTLLGSAEPELVDWFQHHRRLLELGVVVGVHSDAGVTDTPFGRLVDSLRVASVGLALSPGQALARVTRVAARIVGADGELGVIAPGAVADLIAVQGDPALDLDALERVRRVYRGGQLVARDGRVMPVHTAD